VTVSPRGFSLLLALLVVATLVSAAAGPAQGRQGDLPDLWSEYPLEPGADEPRSVEAREERGSTAGPPPAAAKRAGPVPLAFLFLALALAVVGVAGGALQGVGRLRARRQRIRSARRRSQRPRRQARRGLLGGGDG
jgi:hypothetical protein